MKDALLIVIFGVLIYLGFSTILGDTELMGSYGAIFASYNKLYFGYVAFVYLFVLLLPLYSMYKTPSFDFRKAQIGVTSFLVLFSFLLAQGMLVTDELRGKFGADFVDFLSPYIGLFGLWVFWFIISSVSILMIFDKTTSEFFVHMRDYCNEKLLFIKFEKQEPEYKFEKKREVYEEKIEKRTPPTVEQESSSETVEEQEFEEIDTPSYLRAKSKKVQGTLLDVEETYTEPVKETSKKEETTILDLAKEVKEHKGTVVVDELEENAKLLADIEKGTVEKPKNFNLPPLKFLQKPKSAAKSVDESELDDKIRYLIEKLAHFNIEGDVVRTYAGPVVSTFEFKPAANVKVSKILNLQDDLAMALSAETIRIQAPIPGKDVVGIEIPNDTVDTIYLREILDNQLFQDSSSPLTIALGKDIVGKPFVTDLKKLPHLLIAGTTGSGKSVGINAMILSLLYKNSPDQLRLLMIDPKMLEFSTYNDIPHLLTPVITKPKQAIAALNNMVAEMERRYELMADTRTKNIENYNEKVKNTDAEHFPYIVVIIDELADLMMTSGKDVEVSIARLAQKSRACGIHLIVATQRPSVDVVTGLIKANLPSRISYRVGQKVDSKIILDQMGAESLLGRGDMLFTPPGAPALVRLHAPWATEEEIENIVEFIKSQRAPNYDKSFLLEEKEGTSSLSSDDSYEELDDLFEEAKNVVLTDRKTSISYLQRKLQIGYNRSARVIEQLENEGVLSAPNAKGIREIL
ncbi:MAG: DNA translocase FtsK [Campylobacterales bacterium]|nr:DNA translocase FtsK [Campylobacterales bacterium]